MIKIIKGIYGYRDAKGDIIPKTSEDKAFCLPEDKESKLVKRGIALYVEERGEKPEEDAVNETQERLEMSSQAVIEELMKTGYAELKSKAKEMGIATDGKKEELARRIENAVANRKEEENPPVLMPEDPE